jgi:hypothetical protein
MESAAMAQIPTLTPPRNNSCPNARNMNFSKERSNLHVPQKP